MLLFKRKRIDEATERAREYLEQRKAQEEIRYAVAETAEARNSRDECEKDIRYSRDVYEEDAPRTGQAYDGGVSPGSGVSQEKEPFSQDERREDATYSQAGHADYSRDVHEEGVFYSRDVFDEDVSYSLRVEERKPKQVDEVVRGMVFGDEAADSRRLDELLQLTFSEKLIQTVDDRGLKDSAVYKAAQLDRRLYSKITTDRHYRPSKDTAVALCLALRLNLDDARDMLSRAGYALSPSDKRDLLLEFFFREGLYDLPVINGVLERLGQKLLGQ